MDTILRALADPTIRAWYLALCVAALLLPMIAIAGWYHLRIGGTRRGQDLMNEQARIGVPGRSHPIAAFQALRQALGLAKGISAGRYGNDIRQLQNRVYWICGAWLAANALLFGLLIWADEVNRLPG